MKFNYFLSTLFIFEVFKNYQISVELYILYSIVQNKTDVLIKCI